MCSVLSIVHPFSPVKLTGFAPIVQDGVGGQRGSVYGPSTLQALRKFTKLFSHNYVNILRQGKKDCYGELPECYFLQLVPL